MDQPVPTFSRADVERVVIREFGSSSANGVWKILELYGRESWQKEVERVWMAALKSSRRDVNLLKKIVASACEDYRDVLVDAEYPNYARVDHKEIEAMMETQRAALVAADWEQYQEWVGRV